MSSNVLEHEMGNATTRHAAEVCRGGAGGGVT